MRDIMPRLQLKAARLQQGPRCKGRILHYQASIGFSPLLGTTQTDRRTIASGVDDMTTTSEIRIIGFDPARPPRVRKESYIDLYFALSTKAPLEWCEDFNIMGRRINPSPKIDASKGEIIDSYVNKMEQIAPHLAVVKKAVSVCNEQYLEKLRQRELALAASSAILKGQGGEQNRLNEIIETLDFESR